LQRKAIPNQAVLTMVSFLRGSRSTSQSPSGEGVEPDWAKAGRASEAITSAIPERGAKKENGLGMRADSGSKAGESAPPR
jgi:hypothetical protein